MLTPRTYISGMATTPRNEGSATAEKVLSVIKKMPEAERLKLFRTLDAMPEVCSGYAVIPKETIEMLLEANRAGTKREIEIFRMARGYADKLPRNKSGAKKILRNVDICDLRKQDRVKWSLGRLSRKFDLSVRRISKVLETEAEWRRKAVRLGTD